MDTFIPFISYTWADDHGANWSEQHERRKERRTRLWTVVKFVTPDDSVYSCEAKVIIEPFNDFCGGLVVRSPQVSVHSSYNDSWGGQRQFCYPSAEEEIGLSFRWSALDQFPDRIVDLAEATGKERWDCTEVEDYMWQCMARSVLTNLIAKGKRGFVGADHLGGRMTTLVKAIAALEGTIVPTSHVSSYSIIDDVTSDPAQTWFPRCASTVNTTVVNVTTPDLDPWLNANSGNEVHWLPVNMSTEQDGHDDGDGYYDEYDEWIGDDSDEPPQGRERVPEAIQRVYSNRNFVRGVPRVMWRNG